MMRRMIINANRIPRFPLIVFFLRFAIMYLTPILWDIKSLPHALQIVMKLNPIYYLVCGYRDCFFYHEGILFYWKQMLVFWGWTIILFWVGSTIMYKFRTKFMDLI